MYEALGLIPKPDRKANGYRVFNDLHLDQFKLARTAFQMEVMQNGLRKQIIEVVKLSANQQYDRAILSTQRYLQTVRDEIRHAAEAAQITKSLLEGDHDDSTMLLKRKEASQALGITMDTLRNWEMNGLLHVRRRENGYRVYNQEDLQKLKIIRSLRCANYSLSAILRMMNAFNRNSRIDIQQTLDTPDESEDVISVCDKLISSLQTAEKNAEQILVLLKEMQIKYSNPPL